MTKERPPAGASADQTGFKHRRVFAHQKRLELILVLGACALFFFSRLDSFGLLGADEPRYAQVAHEMMASHNYVTPVLYGLPWLEKPVAYYWGAIASFKLFGVSDAAARFPVALAASLMVLLIYLLYGRLRPKQRIDAALMTASTALVIGMGRAASTDMVMAAPLTVALVGWYLWYELGERRWLVLSYAMLGIAVLAKGPVAPVLAAVIVAAFCATQREWKKLIATLWPVGLLIFCAVALPWYVLVQHQTPQFFHVFFLQHNLGRFGSNAFHHKQPFWYYLPVLLLATAPWTMLAVTSLVDGFVRWRRALKDRTEVLAAGQGLTVFLFLWAVLPVLFFSFSQSKLPGYILPSIPAAMLLACDLVHRRMESGKSMPHWLTITHALLLALLASGVILSPALLLKTSPTSPEVYMAVLVGLLVLGGVVSSLLRKGWAGLRYATLVPLALLLCFALMLDAPIVEQTMTARPAAQLLQKLGVGANESVYTFHLSRTINFGLGFYRNAQVNAYEGLAISPGVREMPPVIPSRAHILLTREGSAAELLVFFPAGDWVITPLGTLPEQHIEVLRIEPVHAPPQQNNFTVGAAALNYSL